MLQQVQHVCGIVLCVPDLLAALLQPVYVQSSNLEQGFLVAAHASATYLAASHAAIAAAAPAALELHALPRVDGQTHAHNKP